MPGKSKLEEVIRAITKNNKVPTDQVEKVLLSKGVKPDEIKQANVNQYTNLLNELGIHHLTSGNIEDFLRGRNDYVRTDTNRVYESISPEVLFNDPNNSPLYFSNEYSSAKSNLKLDTAEDRISDIKFIRSILFDNDNRPKSYIPQFSSYDPLYNPEIAKKYGPLREQIRNDYNEVIMNLADSSFHKVKQDYIDKYDNLFKEMEDEVRKQEGSVLFERMPYDWKQHKPASGHFGFDQPGYFGHTRGYDLPDARVLFELQSDLHQGSRFGYGDPVSDDYDLADFDTAKKLFEGLDFNNWRDRIKTDEFKKLNKRYNNRYIGRDSGGNEVKIDYKSNNFHSVRDFLGSLSIGADFYKDTYKRLPDQPFKDEKWLGRLIEREADTAFQAGKPLKILRSVDNEGPKGAMRAPSVQRKYYDPGAEIDKTLRALAQKHGWSVEDVDDFSQVKYNSFPDNYKENSTFYNAYNSRYDKNSFPSLVDLINSTSAGDSPDTFAFTRAGAQEALDSLIHQPFANTTLARALERNNYGVDPNVTLESLVEKGEIFQSDVNIIKKFELIRDKLPEIVDNFENANNIPLNVANYIKIIDPKNIGAVNFLEYGRARPETLAILGTAGLTGFGLQQFMDKKEQEGQANRAAQQVVQQSQDVGPPVNAGLDQFIAQQRAAREQPEAESLSSPSIGQQALNFGGDVLDSLNMGNLRNAGANVGIDWLDALNKVQYTGSALFGQEDLDEYIRQREYIESLREQNKLPGGAGNTLYHGLSLIAGP